MNAIRKVQTKKNLKSSKSFQKKEKRKDTDKVIDFYRSFGNKNLIQRKISVGKAEDKYEKEADMISEKVISNSEVQGGQEEPFEEKIHKKENTEFEKSVYGENKNQVNSEIEQKIKTTKSLGKPLEKGIKSEMESKFGADFSDVKIHTGSYSSELNKKLKSYAFTYGNHIYFGEGKYSPETVSGKKLLAHELTHVIQQNKNKISKQNIQKSQKKIQKFSIGRAWRWLKGKVKKGIDAVKDLGKKISELAGDLKRALLDKLAGFIQEIPGFKLLTFILGKNPVTGEPVERNFNTLIESILSFIPGANEFIQKLKEAKIVEKAGEWFSKEFKKLKLSWGYIKGLFKKAWNSLTIGDIKNPENAFQKLKNIFSPPLIRIKNFVINLIKKIPQFIFETALIIIGAPVKLVMRVLNKGKDVFTKIISNPISFLRNLISAVKTGFFGFFKRIKKYLIKGLFSWLFGTLEKAGLKMPEKFDLKGILSIILQVLGLTYRKIREKLAKRIGEDKVQKLEETFELIINIKNRGIKALIDFISEKFGNFLNTIKSIFIEKIRNWVITRIITEAISKLAKLWNPVGAIIEAIQNIYRLIMFFWENAKRIALVVAAVFNSIGEIAAGKIKKASIWIEKTLGRTVPIVISFFARMIGLGGISKTIRNIIKKIQSKVDKLLDKAVDWIVEKVSNLWIVKAGKRAVEKVKELKEKAVEKGKIVLKKGVMLIKNWWKKKISVKKNGKNYQIYMKGKDGRVFIKSSPEEEIIYHPLMDYPDIRNEYASLISKIRNKEELTPEENSKINSFFSTIKAKIETQEFGETKIGYGGLYEGTFGTLAYAENITKTTPEGSPPSVNNEKWRILSKRRTSAGSKDYYYVRGHLLNEKLGGTGRDWRNLTPLTQSANNRSKESHFHKVEKKLQDIKKEGSKIKFIDYYVHAEYGRGEPVDYNYAPKKIKEVMEAEKLVPKKLIAIADIYGKENKKLEEIREVINNEISQNISSYFFENEKITEINLNKDSASTISNFLGINRLFARKIIEERRKAKFETYEEFKERMKRKKEIAEKVHNSEWNKEFEKEFEKIESNKDKIKVA